jgi:hypothetical protein
MLVQTFTQAHKYYFVPSYYTAKAVKCYTEAPKYYSAPNYYTAAAHSYYVGPKYYTAAPGYYIPTFTTLQPTLPSAPIPMLPSSTIPRHRSIIYLGGSDLMHRSCEVFHCPELLHRYYTIKAPLDITSQPTLLQFSTGRLLKTRVEISDFFICVQICRSYLNSY